VQVLQTGQVLLVPLAGDALLSPDKLTSDPHGHGGQVVGAAVVVGIVVDWNVGAAVVVGVEVVAVAVVVGQALQVGQASPLRLILLAGEALLSPDKLDSPHGHGGQVVSAALVVGLVVSWTVGADVEGEAVEVQSCSQFSP